MSSVADTPTVSVIIATYRRPQLLPRAIRSVLAQTYTDFEVIVVDDASGDETPEVVASFTDPRLRYLCMERNGGVNRARNTATAQARGELFVFLDDDDRVEPEFLSVMTDQFGKAPRTVGFALPWRLVVRMDAAGTEHPLGVHRQKHATGGVFPGARMRRTPAGGSSGLMVRAEALRKLGGFDETMRSAGDTDLLIRLAQSWDYLVVAEPLYVLSVIEGAQLTNFHARRGDNLKVLVARYGETVAPRVRRTWLVSAARNYYGGGACPEGRAVMQQLIRERPWHPSAYIWWMLFENRSRLPAWLERHVFRPHR